MKEKIKKLLRSSNKEDIMIAMELMQNNMNIKDIKSIFGAAYTIHSKIVDEKEFYPYFYLGDDYYVIHHFNSTWIHKEREFKDPNMYQFLKPFYLGEHKDLKL